MSLSVKCPGCSQVFKMPEQIAGKKVRCKNCQRVFRIAAVELSSSSETLGSARNPMPGQPVTSVKKRSLVEHREPEISIPTQTGHKSLRAAILAVVALSGGTILFIALIALFVIKPWQIDENGLGFFEDDGPIVFANAETQAFFTTPGWFKLEATERYGIFRTSPNSSIGWEILEGIKEFQAAMEEKLGEDWFEEFPNAYMSRVGGQAESKYFLNDDFEPMVHAEKVPIVGIRYSVHRPFGSALLSNLLPVYHRDEEKVPIMARDGYAIAGMDVVFDELSVHRIQVIFMRIVDGRFDRRDQYTSEWIGLQKTRGKQVRLVGDGRAVYGMAVAESAGYLIGIRLFCDAR